MKTFDEMARAAINRYNREWRSKNRERVREYNHRYWIKRALREKEAAQDETNG